MKRFSFVNTVALILFLLAISFTTEAHAAPHGDFDGDGLPDIVAVQKFKKGKVRTRWIVRLSSNNTNRIFDFKLAGDAMVVQRRNGISYPGIVNVEKVNRPLRWSIYQPDGSVYNFKWSRPGATITQAGDFNGNGIDDCIAVTSGKWDIALDCNPGNVRSFLWGNAGETVRVYNDQVLNVAAAYVLRNVSGNLRWISRTLDGVSRDMGFGLATDIPVGVEAFNGIGSIRHLVVARKTSTGMKIYLGNASGTIERILGSNSGIPFVGSDNARGFYGIYDRATALSAIQRLTGPTTFVQHGGSSYWFVAPNGTVYPTGTEATGIIGSGGGGGGTQPPINFAGCTTYLDITDGRSKHNTYNPNNSRRTAKFIYRAEYQPDFTIRNVRIYYPDGTFFKNMYHGGYEHGGRSRFYTEDRPSIASHPQNMVIVADLIPNEYYGIGSGKVCAVIPNPRQRYD